MHYYTDQNYFRLRDFKPYEPQERMEVPAVLYPGDKIEPVDLAPVASLCDKHHFGKNVAELLDTFMPEIDGMDTHFSSLQKDVIAQAVTEIYNTAYLDGVQEGTLNGLIAWDNFLGSPLDSTLPQSPDSVEYLCNLADWAWTKECYKDALQGRWAQLIRRLPADAIKQFANSHNMHWTRAMDWLDKIGGAVASHQYWDENDTVLMMNTGELFGLILWHSDMFEIEHSLGIQYYHDTCDFYIENTDELYENRSFELARDAITQQDLLAYQQGVSLDDIFVGRSSDPRENMEY